MPEPVFINLKSRFKIILNRFGSRLYNIKETERMLEFMKNNPPFIFKEFDLNLKLKQEGDVLIVDLRTISDFLILQYDPSSHDYVMGCEPKIEIINPDECLSSYKYEPQVENKYWDSSKIRELIKNQRNKGGLKLDPPEKIILGIEGVEKLSVYASDKETDSKIELESYSTPSKLKKEVS